MMGFPQTQMDSRHAHSKDQAWRSYATVCSRPTLEEIQEFNREANRRALYAIQRRKKQRAYSDRVHLKMLFTVRGFTLAIQYFLWRWENRRWKHPDLQQVCSKDSK
jgi:hypothetical protein